ncbi:1,4-alpha-glucan branching enzyme [Desulfobaculum xiamenense]|uniref:1,4-alpha-glucan branching enzyme n=1 Tax=Desulfobaculum xiamenense TaxID=995050 RepID=A0A846QFJ2_9BACT|nr:isoamylase early set domain-containing protein [Desulfobaculum xiamenense]NJB67098.1 1,4-alpha-glucan branching enzyme [Desulfobaculum xiamenense]
MSLKKMYLRSKPVCKVTFRVPKESADGAKHVSLVGEFNNWSEKSTPMKRLKNGDYTLTLELETGRSFQYRYLIDKTRWENDGEADAYVRSTFGNCDNSVVTT